MGYALRKLRGGGNISGTPCRLHIQQPLMCCYLLLFHSQVWMFLPIAWCASFCLFTPQSCQKVLFMWVFPHPMPGVRAEAPKSPKSPLGAGLEQGQQQEGGQQHHHRGSQGMGLRGAGWGERRGLGLGKTLILEKILTSHSLLFHGFFCVKMKIFFCFIKPLWTLGKEGRWYGWRNLSIIRIGVGLEVWMKLSLASDSDVSGKG